LGAQLRHAFVLARTGLSEAGTTVARGRLTGRYQTRIFAAFDGEISLRDRS
jgi:hypothetical protein